MHPALLPPLDIPKRWSARPVLLDGLMDQPIYRPSYHSLPPKPRPQPRPTVDFDDIEVFNFFNPCLLPPSQINPIPARLTIDRGLVELPARTRGPSPCPAPDVGLRRSTLTVTRRGRSYRRRSNGNPLTQSYPRSRSPSPAFPESGPPSPSPLSPEPRRVNLPQWDEYSVANMQWDDDSDTDSQWDGKTVAGSQWDECSVVDMAPSSPVAHQAYSETEWDDTPVESQHTHRAEETLEDDTPYLKETEYWLRQETGPDGEQAALRELWGAIDGMLGPGANLGDYDTKSVAGTVDGLRTPVDDWNGDVRRGSDERVRGDCGREASWWGAVRRSLLLS